MREGKAERVICNPLACGQDRACLLLVVGGGKRQTKRRGMIGMPVEGSVWGVWLAPWMDRGTAQREECSLFVLLMSPKAARIDLWNPQPTETKIGASDKNLIIISGAPYADDALAAGRR